MRFGEVTELRRKDFDRDCAVVTISRGVTHRQGQCRIGSTKNGEQRIVTIPPHIREDMKAHLAHYVSDNPEALLFTPVRGGCHLNDRVFNKDVFKKAAKDVGREDLSAHDLRRFAGSKNAQVATLTENMARLGHKTVGAALRYQHSQDGRDAIVAANLSANALAELKLPRGRELADLRGYGAKKLTKPCIAPTPGSFFGASCARDCAKLAGWPPITRPWYCCMAGPGLAINGGISRRCYPPTTTYTHRQPSVIVEGQLCSGDPSRCGM